MEKSLKKFEGKLKKLSLLHRACEHWVRKFRVGKFFDFVFHAHGEFGEPNKSNPTGKRGGVMKIVARINGERQDLVNSLTQRGIKVKLVKRGVIVELPEKDGNYELPPEVAKEINGGKLFIDTTEHGGGATNTGSGTVVCGLSGKPLRPYYVPRSGHLACGTHAYFSVPEAIVTVTGYRRDTNITIEEHRIIHEGNTSRIETKTLWSGELEVLPDSFNRFQAVAEAASAKGNCYHCRDVHFFEAQD